MSWALHTFGLPATKELTAILTKVVVPNLGVATPCGVATIKNGVVEPVWVEDRSRLPAAGSLDLLPSPWGLCGRVEKGREVQ